MTVATARAEEPSPVPLPSITVAKPTIAGTRMVGYTLTAKHAAPTPATAIVTYQWLRDGVPIAGANTATRKLATADGGHKIAVRISLAAEGYEPATSTSSNTATIKARPSIDSAKSVWVVVNKLRPLSPKTYKPSGLKHIAKVPGGSTRYLRSDAAALTAMYTAARKANRKFSITSAYRSYSTQKSLFASYARQYGTASAERFSARAGHSEHQTGLAVDLYYSQSCRLKACFGSEASGKWVAANAYKYGFIVRYPKGKEYATGYKYEPWHLRYVGVELATSIHNGKAKTLEGYFKLPWARNYR